MSQPPKLPIRGTEQYFIEQDEFRRYVANQVNPARVEAGLKPIDDDSARECFRIIYDFHKTNEERDEQRQSNDQ